MNEREHATALQISTNEPLPLDRRHGTAGELFTVWFGSNLMLLTIVTGGLAVTVFGLPFGWDVAGLVLGYLVGAIFMARHAAQGPTLGVPQMIQTRGQFGSLWFAARGRNRHRHGCGVGCHRISCSAARR